MDWLKNRSNKANRQYEQQQYQQSEQKQIQRQTEVQTEVLKDEIDSIFDIFNCVLNYIKSDKVKQSGLMSWNDSAVATLNLFGQQCKKEESGSLNVAHHHFTGKKQEMDVADQRVIEPWLRYVEAALLGKKVKKLRISQETIDRAHYYMKEGGLQAFLDSYVGAEHDSSDFVRNVKENKDAFREKHSRAAQQNEAFYQQRQGMVQCPGQQAMYGVVGNAQNIQYGSASNHPTSKYYNKQQNKGFDEQEKKQQSKGMNVDASASNNDNQKKYPWMNAYVIKAPSQTITRGNKPVNIRYPYPCRIAEGVIFDNGQVLGVVYAKPNDDLRVKISVSNLERDTVKVSKLEQQYMSDMKITGLGYESILQQQFQ